MYSLLFGLQYLISIRGTKQTHQRCAPSEKWKQMPKNRQLKYKKNTKQLPLIRFDHLKSINKTNLIRKINDVKFSMTFAFFPILSVFIAVEAGPYSTIRFMFCSNKLPYFSFKRIGPFKWPNTTHKLNCCM